METSRDNQTRALAKDDWIPVTKGPSPTKEPPQIQADIDKTKNAFAILEDESTGRSTENSSKHMSKPAGTVPFLAPEVCQPKRPSTPEIQHVAMPKYQSIPAPTFDDSFSIKSYNSQRLINTILYDPNVVILGDDKVEHNTPKFELPLK